MLRWLSFPPVISSVLLLFTVLLGNKSTATSVPFLIWGVFIAAYVCICSVSLYFISQKNGRYSLGISLIAQGLLLSVLSQQFGAFIISWLGMLLFFSGLIGVFFYVTQGETSMHDVENPPPGDLESLNAAERESMTNLLWKFSFPIAVTDSKGVIIGANQSFYDALGSEPGSIEGNIINEVLPLDEDEVSLDSGHWWISQAKEGSRFYFSLLPTPNCKPMEQVKTPSSHHHGGGEVSIFDPATRLYTDEYRKIRGPEEVARAQRYTRQLSGILLELSFEPASEFNVSPQQRDMLFQAFSIKVKSLLRSMDCAFMLGDQRIQILLPETPGGGAKTLLSRLTTIPQTVFDEQIRDALNPKVKAGMYFYNGAQRMEYGIFSATLEEALMKAKEAAAVEAA